MAQYAQTPADPQRLRALEQANQVRLARAELKRRITGGEVSAAEVILDCPEAAQRWTVSDLLMAQRRWGATRCRKFLERNGISEIKAIGALTERQRQLLAAELAHASVGAGPSDSGLRHAAVGAGQSAPERELALA